MSAAKQRRLPQQPPEQSFMLELEFRPGTPLREVLRLEQRLQEHAEALDLLLSAGQLRHTVLALDGELSAADQVALLDWLVDQPGIVAVRVGPIGTDSESRGGAFVQMHTGDVALIGLTLLHRCGRVTPQQYLQILGGYVRAVHIH